MSLVQCECGCTDFVRAKDAEPVKEYNRTDKGKIVGKVVGDIVACVRCKQPIVVKDFEHYRIERVPAQGRQIPVRPSPEVEEIRRREAAAAGPVIVPNIPEP